MAEPPQRRRRRRPSLGTRLMASPAALAGAAWSVALYLRTVKATSRIITVPHPIAPFTGRHTPFIGVGWHGQFLLMPVLNLDGRFYDALASHHADGEIIARVLARFGHRAVRGSGAADAKRMHEKGGIQAFRNMQASLDEGRSVVLTADFARSARREVSRGIITLARMSGRPVIPLGVATSRAVTLDSWDKTTINLPFSRAAVVLGEPIPVPAEIDREGTDALRQTIAREIDAVNARAHDIAHNVAHATAAGRPD